MLMLAWGRGRWSVSQKPIMIRYFLFLLLVGESGLSKFKGAVNLINLNILDKLVKTLWHKGANDVTERF